MQQRAHSENAGWARYSKAFSFHQLKQFGALLFLYAEAAVRQQVTQLFTCKESRVYRLIADIMKSLGGREL